MRARPVINIGSKGHYVVELQKLLNNATSPSPGLKIDGDFGEKTLKTVLKFQKTVKLKGDGIVGKRTWKALVDANIPKDNIIFPQFLLADIAAQYIGVKETGNNRAGNSKKCRKYSMLMIFLSGARRMATHGAQLLSHYVSKSYVSNPCFMTLSIHPGSHR
jgi:lysozyme family protein